jgi:uncharacterized protein YbcI
MDRASGAIMACVTNAPNTDSASVSRDVARALGAAIKKYYGKGPVSSKAHFVEDDILIVVMREPATTAEAAMVKAGRENEARDFRLAFQNEYGGELRGIVETLTGRKIATYHSQIMFEPDVLFEIFVFEREGEDGPGGRTG